MNLPGKLKKCCESGRNCCVGLQGAGKPLIYKGEILTPHVLGEQKKTCDCFMFIGDSHVLLVELKSRTIKFEDIQEKFDNGVSVIKQLSGSLAIGRKIVPVLLAKAYGSKPSNNPRARRLTVKIDGKPNSIVYGKCGMHVSEIISKS